MSREMVLVPLAQWQRMKKASVQETVLETVQPTNPLLQIEEAPPSLENEIIDLLPKMYHARAKVILHYLLPSLKLDRNKHVIYDDGPRGAHILDYLRYILNPLKTRAPVDVEKFSHVLNAVGVPRSVYNVHVIEKSSHWLTF